VPNISDGQTLAASMRSCVRFALTATNSEMSEISSTPAPTTNSNSRLSRRAAGLSVSDAIVSFLSVMMSHRFGRA
jgi:hypothetical protein